MKLNQLFALTIAALAAAPAFADINVGVIASLTGPAAALGAETKKAIALFPSTVGGEKVNFILLDDGTDPTSAVKNVRKLISEDKVDAILGPNLISTATAMADVTNAEKTPMVSVAPLDVSGDKRGYVFRSEPSADLMVNRIVTDMLENGAKTVAEMSVDKFIARRCALVPPPAHAGAAQARGPSHRRRGERPRP